MTQVQNMQKRYVTPALTVYGRLEDVTLLWSNPTSTDNTCPGAIGSQNLNSGTFCAQSPSRRTDANVTDPNIIEPTIEDPLAAPIDPLAEDLLGSSS